MVQRSGQTAAARFRGGRLSAIIPTMGRHRRGERQRLRRPPAAPGLLDVDELHVPASATAVSAPPVTPVTLLALQRTAGNAAATALLHRDAAPRVTRGAGGPRLRRTTVDTNGGVFDNAPMYSPVRGTGAVGERVGANIMIDFTPGDLVEAPLNGVVLIQTVKGVTDKKPDGTLGATRDQGDTAVTDNPDDRSLVGASGVAIDVSVHPGQRDEPNTNPVYGVGFGAPAPSASLRDGTPTLGRTQRGAHVRDPVTGVLSPPVRAQMEDGPGRVLAVAGQSFEMTFEVAALVTDGPMQDTYLGSVEWGWQSDATGTVTLKPFTPLASGAPTATFMGAATTWNAATFHDQSFWGTLLDETAETVDLPITTLPSGVKAAVDMTTPEILARSRVVQGEIAGLPAGPGVDRTNKEFELRALVTELAKRKIQINLTCNSISDTGSAANPAEDEVGVSLDGGGGGLGLTLTGNRTYRAGDAHTYTFPVTDFMPLTGSVHVEVIEHDRAGPGGRAHDDVLIALDWLPPFAPVVRADPGGHYTARIGFNK
jgi:hypothetical protein